MAFPQKNKNRFIIWSSNTTPAYIHPKEMKAGHLKKISVYSHSQQHYSRQWKRWKQSSAHQQMSGETKCDAHVHPLKGIQSSEERKFWHATWMNLEDIVLSEMSQWQGNSDGMISPTGGIKSGPTQRERVELRLLGSEGRREWGVAV